MLRRLPAPALAVAATFALAGCAAGAASTAPPTPSAAVDPPAATGGPDASVESPHEVVLTADLGDLRDDLTGVVVETRQVVVGHRRRVTTATSEGIVDQHVITPEGHWLRVPASMRETVLDAAWIHFDLDELARAGARLPDHAIAARRPLPPPHEVVVGQMLGGRRVTAVEVLDDDAVRLVLDGSPVAMTLRRRRLPATTRIEVPRGAIDVRDLRVLPGRG